MCVNSLYPRPSRYRPLPWLRCTIHHQSPASPTVLCLAVQCPPLPRHELCKIYLHKYEKYICTSLCLALLNKYICAFSSVTTRCKLRGWPSWNKSPFRSYLQTLDINSCKIALLRGLGEPLSLSGDMGPRQDQRCCSVQTFHLESWSRFRGSCWKIDPNFRVKMHLILYL